MRDKFDILSGFKFGRKNFESQKLQDIALDGKIGAILPMRADSVLFNIAPEKAVNLITNGTDNATLSDTGVLRVDTSIIDTGYTTPGGMIVMAPNSIVNTPHLFVAANKMTKYDGTTVKKWGIDVPPAAALTVAQGAVVETTIQACENSADWTPTGGFAVADEPNIIQEGVNSLRITTVANVLGTITTTFGAPFDFSSGSDEDVIAFWLRFEQPLNLQLFSITFSLANNDFRTSTAQRFLAFEYAPEIPGTTVEIERILEGRQSDGGDEESEFVDESRETLGPVTGDTWKEIRIRRGLFKLVGPSGWDAVYRMRFVIQSTTVQNIYIDDIRMRTKGMNDVIGARYKYRYYDSNTGNAGNLNETPSESIIGDNRAITVSGFVAPPSGQGITHIQVFRDIARDGSFKLVNQFVIPSPFGAPTFSDTTPIVLLGDTDNNDQAVPLAASKCVFWRGSAWLNDLSNPQRLQKSVTGRPESFALSGLYTVSSTEDPIVSIDTVNAQLTIWTRNKTYEARGSGTLFEFIQVADLGAAQVSVSRDFALVINASGLWIYDGNRYTIQEELSALFNTQSKDPRRITETNLDSVRIGTDERHIFFTYNLLAGTQKCLVFSIESRTWTEKTTHIPTAFDRDHAPFYTLASDNAGNVIELGAAATSTAFVFETPTIEFNATRAFSINIDYVSSVNLTATLIVDDLDQPGQTLLAKSTRGISSLVVNKIGVRASVRLTGIPEAIGVMEIYGIEILGADLGAYAKAYDSGELHFGRAVVPLSGLVIHLFGFAVGTYTLEIRAGGTLISTQTAMLEANNITSIRHDFTKVYTRSYSYRITADQLFSHIETKPIAMFEYNDAKLFDSEHVSLGSKLSIPSTLVWTLFAVESGLAEIDIYVGEELATQVDTFVLTKLKETSGYATIKPIVGRSIRVVITGTSGFSILLLAVDVIDFGNGELSTLKLAAQSGYKNLDAARMV